ncbi:MAG TPA: hypothetical protein VN442_04840 [Bryobacteraceae bacterium]|nr:hypothetical protein [Bryobacteraceae bacterium]
MKWGLLTGAGVVLAILAVLAGALWYWLGRPSYRPGVVRAGGALTPPPQDHDESFREIIRGPTPLHR